MPMGSQYLSLHRFDGASLVAATRSTFDVQRDDFGVHTMVGPQLPVIREAARAKSGDQPLYEGSSKGPTRSRSPPLIQLLTTRPAPTGTAPLTLRLACATLKLRL